MQIIRPTYQEIVEQIYRDVTQQTNFRGDLDDSALGVLIKSLAARINEGWDFAEQVATQSDPNTATGEGLDLQGARIGALRKPATQASSLGYSKPIRFTNLGGSQVTIPVGTRIWGSDPQLAFFTLEGISLLGGSSGEVHVRAAEVGDIYNVPIGYLTQHSFPGSVSVTNILPIQEGSYRESDESYRSRIISEYRRRITFNSDTCSELMRSDPNVKDVILIDKPFGPGTFDIIIDPYVVSQLPQTISVCQSLLDQFGYIGSAGRVLAPTLRNLDIAITLTFKPNTQNQQEIRNEIRAQITALLSSIPIETGEGQGTVWLDQIRGIAINSDSQIINAEISVGLDNRALNSTGAIRLNRGEKINLRSLIVQ